MVRVCVFPGCNKKMKRYNPESFHRFPLQNSDMLKQWLVVLHVDVETPVETLRQMDYRVCSKHFDKDDFILSKRASNTPRKNQHIKKSAVPRGEIPVADHLDEDKHRKKIHESEDMRIKETFCVKQDETEEQIKLVIIKEEIEDLRNEETFSVKQEETEEQINLEIIKEESEDLRNEETFSVKQEETEEQIKLEIIKEEIKDVKIEETEEQTDLKPLKEESQHLNEMEEKDQDKTHHDFITEEKSMNCSQAETTSSRKTSQRTGNIGDFICHLCGLRFKKHGNLEVHMKVHTGRKLYPCQQCGVIFRQQGSLKVHMRIHTGEKPFTCSQCGKSFRQKGNLNNHMRVHTGESPFTCQHCGMSFRQKGNLIYHLRVHTGEKPYACKQCGTSFTQKGNLTKHMIIHNSNPLHANK